MRGAPVGTVVKNGPWITESKALVWPGDIIENHRHGQALFGNLCQAANRWQVPRRWHMDAVVIKEKPDDYGAV
jgi:hypothetical protein